MEFIKSKDREERAAKVSLPSRNTLQRSLCQLFSLECDERLDNSDENTKREKTSIDKSSAEGKRQNRKQLRIHKQQRRQETRPTDNIWRMIDN